MTSLASPSAGPTLRVGSPPLRRFWPALAALLVLALLSSVHSLVFSPLAGRYQQQLHAAADLGAPLDPRLVLAPLPPRVTDMLRKNSLSEAEADEQSQSGFLATDLVRRLAAAAVGCGIDVAASEPGSVVQTTGTVEVRAQIRLRGRYAQIVRLLDRLASERSLYRIERLSLAPLPGGIVESKVEVARVFLKRSGAPS
jgi:type II secretion system (T2SS) protein M